MNKPKTLEQIKAEPHITLDDRPISDKEWSAYYEKYLRWYESFKDDLRSMEAAMSKPNKPNTFRANND